MLLAGFEYVYLSTLFNIGSLQLNLNRQILCDPSECLFPYSSKICAYFYLSSWFVPFPSSFRLLCLQKCRFITASTFGKLCLNWYPRYLNFTSCICKGTLHLTDKQLLYYLLFPMINSFHTLFHDNRRLTGRVAFIRVYSTQKVTIPLDVINIFSPSILTLLPVFRILYDLPYMSR